MANALHQNLVDFALLLLSVTSDRTRPAADSPHDLPERCPNPFLRDAVVIASSSAASASKT